MALVCGLDKTSRASDEDYDAGQLKKIGLEIVPSLVTDE
jgi:hypothetical protein